MNARDLQVAELRAQAADLRKRGYAALDAGDGRLAQELLDRSILRTEIADALEAGEGQGLQKPLLDDNSARTIIGNMAHAQQASEPRRRGRPTKSKHPFPAALTAAGSTVAEWARRHKVEREVVKSWFAPPPAGRRIPEAMAKAIEKEFKVPATEKVWTNGIR